MSITATGVVIIFVGLYAFLFNERFLYGLTVFFVPFSATAVINVGEQGAGSAIQPYTFLGTLWLIRLFVRHIIVFKKDNAINKGEFYTVCLLLGFVLTAFISLIMPIIINGGESGNITGGLGLSGPILFSARNITQYVYLLFGVFFAIGIYIHNKKESNYFQTIKIYSYSVIFVVIWGGVELFCNFKGIEYPAFLFNNSYNPNAEGYQFFADAGGELKRISSVGIEPSITVQSIVVLIPFILLGLFKRFYIFNKWIDIGFVILLYIFTIRTTSSSGILCLAVLSILTVFFIYKELSSKKKIIFIVLSLIGIPIATSIIYSLFNNIINTMLFEKGDSYSGLERLSSILDAWGTFLQHPILGAGWASVSSFDLFVKILSNTGIIGFAFFSGFLLKVLINKFYSKNLSDKMKVYNSAIIIAFCTIIFGNMINVFSFIFGTFWIISGLAVANAYTTVKST